MGNNLYWLWLSLHCSSHSTLFDRLIRVFRSPEEIYRADSADLATVAGEKSPEILRLSDKNLSDSQRIMEHCMMSDVQILSYGNAAYPARLRLLENPPLVLYVKGKLPVFEESLLITVVGTRRMSDYGKRMTFEISYDLARAGAVVVTGMALGVDGLASASAMEAGGRTLAFLGCGIDIAYPSEHAYLMRRIIESGAVLTEYPPGTRPEGRNFPHRNRLMSGVSHGVLMVEGNRKRGAQISARVAEQQGRDVYVLPGDVDSGISEGPNLLLKNGATPIVCAEDILAKYEYMYHGEINLFRLVEPYRMDADRVIQKYRLAARGTSHGWTAGKPYPAEKRPSGTQRESGVSDSGKAASSPPLEKRKEKAPDALRLLDETTLAVYRHIPEDRAVTVDELCTDEIPAGRVMAALTLLEIHRCVLSVAGGRYVRVPYQES